MIEARPGLLVFRVEGAGAARRFAHEAGGHRWQRVSPTERRGRVHTSTVTVAVLPEVPASQVAIDLGDVELSYTRGSGKGGQHRNKTDTCVLLRHRPSGQQIRVDGGRSQSANREAAFALLRARLEAQRRATSHVQVNTRRREQLGCGARGDKRRTISVPRGQVSDHVLGVTWRAKDYLAGRMPWND
ncbi:MAG: peptide chain release factor-like protein [Nannocystaceae bacterium]